MNRHLLVTAVFIAMGLALGCDKKSASSNGGPAPAKEGLKEVRIGYFGNVTHAQAVLGVSSGEFASAVAPAKVSTKVFNAGPSLVEALFARQIDIGYVGPGPALSAHSKSGGKGIRIVAGAAADGVIIVARKDSGISRFEDLKGKKIAVPQLGNTQDIAAKHYLTKVLGQSDVKNVLPIQNAEQLGLMVNGQIDAAWAPEPWGSRLEVEAGATFIVAEKDLWPNKQFTLTLVVTTPEFIQEHPEVVEKILGVHRSWTKRLVENPGEYEKPLGDALFALNGKRLPEGVLGKSLKNVRFTDDPLVETLAAMAEWSTELGFSKEKITLDNLFDLTILKRLQAK